MVGFKRIRTSSKYIYYALQLYFSGLSLRKVSQKISVFIKRNHVSIWNWIQRYRPIKIMQRSKRVAEFIIDETLIKSGHEYTWLWIAIEPVNKTILDIHISKERNMLIAEQFIKSLVKKHGKCNISTDGGTWYPQACKFLKLKHHVHSFYEKSIIERTIQYVKDRTESFDDYFPCRKERSCKLKHIINWFNMFIDMHNKMITRYAVK
jgi:putative transposase